LSLPPPERSAASLLRWGRIIGLFTTAQVFIQALGALAGVVIVRLLDRDQYALFTIASSFQTSANLLTACGINAGLLSMGGKVWGDRQAAGGLVIAALRLRLRLVILGRPLAQTAVIHHMIERPRSFDDPVEHAASQIFAALMFSFRYQPMWTHNLTSLSKVPVQSWKHRGRATRMLALALRQFHDRSTELQRFESRLDPSSGK